MQNGCRISAPECHLKLAVALLSAPLYNRVVEPGDSLSKHLLLLSLLHDLCKSTVMPSVQYTSQHRSVVYTLTGSPDGVLRADEVR